MKKQPRPVLDNTPVVLACNLKPSPLLGVLPGQNDTVSGVAGHKEGHAGAPYAMPAKGDKKILRQAHLKATINAMASSGPMNAPMVSND